MLQKPPEEYGNHEFVIEKLLGWTPEQISSRATLAIYQFIYDKGPFR